MKFGNLLAYLIGIVFLGVLAWFTWPAQIKELLGGAHKAPEEVHSGKRSSSESETRAKLRSEQDESSLRQDAAAKVEKAKADLLMLCGAIDRFKQQHDRYPTKEEGLEVLTSAPTGASWWRGPYLKENIVVDPWGNSYFYRIPGRNGRDGYLVGSYGADSAPGGEGDDADLIEGHDGGESNAAGPKSAPSQSDGPIPSQSQPSS